MLFSRRWKLTFLETLSKYSSNLIKRVLRGKKEFPEHLCSELSVMTRRDSIRNSSFKRRKTRWKESNLQDGLSLQKGEFWRECLSRAKRINGNYRRRIRPEFKWQMKWGSRARWILKINSSFCLPSFVFLRRRTARQIERKRTTKWSKNYANLTIIGRHKVDYETNENKFTSRHASWSFFFRHLN